MFGKSYTNNATLPVANFKRLRKQTISVTVLNSTTYVVALCSQATPFGYLFELMHQSFTLCTSKQSSLIKVSTYVLQYRLSEIISFLISEII